MDLINNMKEELFNRLLEYCDEMIFTIPSITITEENEEILKFVNKPLIDKNIFECICDRFINT